MTHSTRRAGWVLVSAAAGLLLVGVPARARSDVQRLYHSQCASCHGTDGKGQTKLGKMLGARDFASPEVQKETDAELVHITEKGKNAMPAYEKSLSHAQIVALVGYVRQFARKHARK